MVGGALGGAAPCLGRARLPCRARWVHHLPQGCLASILAPPTAPSLAWFARDWQTSDALRRENAEVWLFEICGSVCSPDGAQRNPRSVAQRSRSPDFAALHPGYEIYPVIPGRLRPCASEPGIQTLSSAVQYLWIPGFAQRGAPRNDGYWVAALISLIASSLSHSAGPAILPISQPWPSISTEVGIPSASPMLLRS
jgi:hypothetical protein